MNQEQKIQLAHRVVLISGIFCGVVALLLILNFWQMKQHLFTSPFYYIDYTLALTGALQFWKNSRSDYGATLERPGRNRSQENS